jgi:hypothetical protein
MAIYAFVSGKKNFDLDFVKIGVVIETWSPFGNVERSGLRV